MTRREAAERLAKDLGFLFPEKDERIAALIEAAFREREVAALEEAAKLFGYWIAERIRALIERTKEDK